MNIDLRVVVGSIIILSIALLPQRGRAQADPFDIGEYSTFLSSHQNLSTEGLLALHPAGTFIERVALDGKPIRYLDTIEQKYQLTEHEKSLLRMHGFVVSERLSRHSMGEGFFDVFYKDLPVFVSTDAILHALHVSYDRILTDVELYYLIPRLEELLTELHGQLSTLRTQYASSPSMTQMLKDVDVYLTVPRKLLNDSISSLYPENAATVTQLLNLIRAEQATNYPLFSSVDRWIDFSQFKVRSHYDDPERPILAKYFKAMMWLGRIEVYLLPPKSVSGPEIPPGDIQRQIIDAVLVLEAAGGSNALPILADINDVIEFFVGESDNVTLPQIGQLTMATGITSASQLLDTNVVHVFQDSLKTKSYAFQRILSQILIANPFDTSSIVPASSFLLLGQRFIIDSYVTGQVVYDRIRYNEVDVRRMLPSTLDVLFALGNDAAAQLLQGELDQYHYGTNLAVVRYLVDHYGSDYWQSSLFNLWLNAIRSLNPPAVRDTLPAFMQTAAWWQEKMNTQLASWAELRHDNLLYAKQSYSGVPVCSFPFSYVEPYPAFYRSVQELARIAHNKFQTLSFSQPWVRTSIVNYFATLGKTVDTLGSIAEKELAGITLSDSEKQFLQKMLFDYYTCTTVYDGWYAKLFYDDDGSGEQLMKMDYIIADVHTAPTDEAGNMIGWVLHAGTGPINLGVVVARLPDSSMMAFVGPMASYHEYLSTNFLRLTDEEWASSYLMTSTRPSFVNLYLADTMGTSRGEGVRLLTSVGDRDAHSTLPQSIVLHSNYPNPFNGSTIIGITIPPDSKNAEVDLSIYNIQGQLVKALIKNTLPAGNILARWDGTDARGRAVPSGVYFYRLQSGIFSQTCKLILMK